MTHADHTTPSLMTRTPVAPEIASQLTGMASWIESHRDVVADTGDALTLIRHRIQALCSTGKDVPASELMELLDMVDMDYLSEEVPGAVIAIDDSISRLRRLANPSAHLVAKQMENELDDEIATPLQSNVIAFRRRQ